MKEQIKFLVARGYDLDDLVFMGKRQLTALCKKEHRLDFMLPEELSDMTIELSDISDVAA